jgi:hypothetical protein
VIFRAIKINVQGIEPTPADLTTLLKIQRMRLDLQLNDLLVVHQGEPVPDKPTATSNPKDDVLGSASSTRPSASSRS